MSKHCAVSSRVEHFLQLVADLFEAHTAAILEAEGEVLRLRAFCSVSDALIPEAEIGSGHGILGWAHREDKLIHATRFDRDTRTLGIYTEDVGIKAVLAAPLPQGKGVIMVDSRNRYAFPERRQRSFRACPAVAYSLLHTDELERAMGHRERFHGLLCELASQGSTPLDTLARHVGAHSGLMARSLAVDEFVVEESWGGWRLLDLEGRSFPMDGGIVGWAFKHRRNLLIPRPLGPHQPLLERRERLPKAGGLMLLHLCAPGGEMVMALNGELQTHGFPRGFDKVLSCLASGAVVREAMDVVPGIIGGERACRPSVS